MSSVKAKIILTAVLALMTIGMGPSLDNIGDSSKPKERIYWPPSPAESKIEYLSAITKPDDIQIKKGFFRRVWEFFAGETQEGITMPFGLFVDDDNRIYVTDTAAQAVHIFDQEDNKYFLIEGPENQRFLYPIGVAVDGQKNIYVSDSLARRVFVFDFKGKFQREIGNDELMHRPTGIVVDKDSGQLFVVDTLLNRIQIYGQDGQLKKNFGEFGSAEGQFNRPTFLSLSPEGKLYVVDSMNARVQVFDKTGAFVSQIGQRGDGSGDLANPRGIGLDSDGNVYLSDTIFEAVQIFDSSGELMLVFGKRGTAAGEFAIPAGIAVSKDDKIYIADSYNMRIQVFQYIKSGRDQKNKKG